MVRTIRCSDRVDFDSAGHVGQLRQVERVDAGIGSDADHGQHHVAGTSDVVDFTLPRRKQLGSAVAADYDHAVAVERDEGMFEFQLLTQPATGREGVFFRADL